MDGSNVREAEEHREQEAGRQFGQYRALTEAEEREALQRPDFQQYVNAQEALARKQLVKNAEDQIVLVPALQVVKQSLFDDVMATTGNSQKQNEQMYRQTIRQLFSEMEEGMEAPEDNVVFLWLAENRRFALENSESYNGVLRAGERFQRQLLRGDMERGRLLAVAEILSERCEEYIGSHEAPFFRNGEERLQKIRELGQRAQGIVAVEDAFAGERDSMFFAEYILAQEEHRRREKLAECVKKMISAWSIEEAPLWLESLREKMTGSDEELAGNYLPYFFPELAKDKRSSEENQSRVLATLSESMLAQRIGRIRAAIDETMGDICFWGARLQATGISGVKLTGSDLHQRGIGIVIVTYDIQGTAQTQVLKPEEKWAEYYLLRTQDDTAQDGQLSLAEEFNRLSGEGKIQIQETDGSLTEVRERIRTIAMQVQAGHGTMVEMVEHKQVEEIKGLGEIVNEEQLLLTQIFCMMLGMSDMHRENLVYEMGDGGKYHAVMIDADNVLSAEKFANESAASQSGMVKNYIRGRKIRIDGIQDFAESVGTQLSRPEVVCRTVLLKTTKLSEARQAILGYQDLPEVLKCIKRKDAQALHDCIAFLGRTAEADVQVDEELKRLLEDKAWISGYNWSLERGAGDAGINKVLIPVHGFSHDYAGERRVNRTPQQEKDAVVCAIEDIMAGQIPFYKYHPGNGNVTTHQNTVIATAGDVGKLCARMPEVFSGEAAGDTGS